MKKTVNRAAAVFLAVAMTFAFMPLLGTQEAHAVEMRDNVTIDFTDGVVELDGAESRAVDFTTYRMGCGKFIGMEQTIVGDPLDGVYEEKFDLDNDGAYDICKVVDTHEYYLSMELLDTCSVYGTRTVNGTDEWLSQQVNLADSAGIPHMYKSVTFKISDKEVRDTYDMLLIEEPYTLTGAEAMAVQNLLIDLADNGSFDETSVTYQNNIPHARYDLDGNGSDDIYTVFDCNARTLYVEKLGTCSVNEPKVFTLPEAAIARQVLYGVEQEYVYKSLTMVMLMPPGPPAIYIENAPVKLSKTAFTYNGKVQKPTIVKIGDMELTKGADYEATWSNASSINAGTYKVTITGKGNYMGTTRATYKINKARNPLAVSGRTATVTYSKVKNAAQKLALYKVIKTTKKGKGTVTYTKKSGNGKITIAKKTGKVTVKKGIKKGTYTVKVNVRAAGTRNYKALTRTVTFKIKVK